MYGCIALGALIITPWVGGWFLLPVLYSLIVGTVVSGVSARFERREYVVAFGIFNAQAAFGAAVMLSGGPTSPLLPGMLLTVILLPARFTTRGVVAGVAMTVVIMLAATAGADPSGFVDNPTYVVTNLVCAIGLAACAHALMRTEVFQRKRAVLDPLTGLLNRQALPERFEEIAVQAAQTDGSVAMIALDIDHFKKINDLHGHARGDAVLQELAYSVRKVLRSFELVYRLGGEEFLVVLPGATLAESGQLAERIRAAIERDRPAGLSVTVSMGVAAAHGSAVAFKPLFEQADGALYAAKRAGRNRVAGHLRSGTPRAA
ncbi:MAG: two-component system, cell cycle response regulator [Solirubrobacteraceae bacterium]|nr:two-component system, cell cycle response regulator [Solirubrobacteraceae bacterium]